MSLGFLPMFCFCCVSLGLGGAECVLHFLGVDLCCWYLIVVIAALEGSLSWVLGFQKDVSAGGPATSVLDCRT